MFRTPMVADSLDWGIFSATSSYSGGDMAQLTQSPTVPNAKAQTQPNATASADLTASSSNDLINTGDWKGAEGAHPKPEGAANTIFLLITDEALAVLQSQGTSGAAIAEQANKNFALKGLDTKVVLWTGDPKNFVINNMSAKSSVAVIGSSRDNTTKFIREKLSPVFANSLDGLQDTDKDGKADVNPDGTTVQNDPWKGGRLNPERSANYPFGNIIAVDGSALLESGQYMRLNKFGNSATLSAAWNILHGAGHNAGLNHDDNNTQFMETNIFDIWSYFRNSTYEDAFKPFYSAGENPVDNFIEAAKLRFGAKITKP